MKDASTIITDLVNSKLIDETPDSTALTIDQQIAIAQAVSLKRIADAMHNPGQAHGSILWWMEIIASAASNGGRQ